MRWVLGIVGVAVLAGAMMVMQGGAEMSLAGVEPETTVVPTTNWALSIDCDADTAPVETSCTVEAGETLEAAIVLRNISEAPRRLESFQVYARTDEAALQPAVATCAFPATACNPDFNEAMGGSLWECDAAADFESEDPAVALSFLYCLNATDAALVPDDGPVISAGESVAIASVTYAAAAAGPAAIEPLFVTAEDGDATQIMSCNPGNVAEGACESASVTVFTDGDGDGYSDADEVTLGENPDSYCAIMRADVNHSGSVNSLDLLQTSFGFTAFNQRYDQNTTGTVNSLDLLLISFQFGLPVTDCAP